MHIEFPPALPYRPERTTLYTIDELLAGDTDAAIARHAERLRAAPGLAPINEALAQRIHDHAIDEALRELLESHPRVVAIMGGHATARTAPEYRQVAVLARALTRADYLVATGGGPGAMEAANLGAWLADHPDNALDEALARLAPIVSFDEPGYLDLALAVRARYAPGRTSLSIPTWFYGHEPSNVFATHIAKYFSNSLREDGLLAIATHGVIYTPGKAGTVQEIFMDASQNHYGTFANASPMVLLDTNYWTSTLPVLNILTPLAAGRAYADLIVMLDDPQEIVHFLQQNPPIPVDRNGQRRAH